MLLILLGKTKCTLFRKYSYPRSLKWWRDGCPKPGFHMKGWWMVPRKSWTSVIFDPISKSRKVLWLVTKSRFSCVSFSLRVSHFFCKVSESRICFFSRDSPAKVNALSEQSQCCRDFGIYRGVSLSQSACSFDLVSADNNHAHALMLKPCKSMVGHRQPKLTKRGVILFNFYANVQHVTYLSLTYLLLHAKRDRKRPRRLRRPMRTIGTIV